jgi:hypothetical protein
MSSGRNSGDCAESGSRCANSALGFVPASELSGNSAAVFYAIVSQLEQMTTLLVLQPIALTWRTLMPMNSGDGLAQATIALFRLSGLRQNARAKYTVRIDGESVGKIAAGESQRYYVQPGQHALQVKIDWVGSPTISVDAESGEVIQFECAPRSSSLALMAVLRGIVQPASYLELWQVQDSNQDEHSG